MNYNLSFDCLIFDLGYCFLDWDILSLCFIGNLRDVLSLVFNWVVVSHVLLFRNLDLDTLGFVLYNWSLIFDIFNS